MGLCQQEGPLHHLPGGPSATYHLLDYADTSGFPLHNRGAKGVWSTNKEALSVLIHTFLLY